MSNPNQASENAPQTRIKKAIAFIRMFVGQMSIKRDNGPIDRISELERFVTTRSAFISQKKHYGYLKTRMGTRYPSMFEDNIFVKSINIASFFIFSACASDLTIFAVAQAFREAVLDNGERERAARQCYRNALEANEETRPDSFSITEAMAAFEARLVETEWDKSALLADNFQLSPKALIEWAPIAKELKQFDTEIVENSMKYAWLDIRERYLKRLDRQGVQADWAADIAKSA